MCNVQCAMCNVQCAMCNVQCAMCNVQCAMCNVQCAMCNVQCAMCNVKLKLTSPITERIAVKGDGEVMPFTNQAFVKGKTIAGCVSHCRERFSAEKDEGQQGA